MSPFRAFVATVLALLVQAGMGRIWPGAHRFLNALLVPVVLCGLAGSQRMAMLVGCGAGLLHDAWFQVGSFGLNGFKWTLLGWALGGVATRLDLNGQAGRLVAGSMVSLADDLLELTLRPLLDLQPWTRGPGEIAGQAVVTGLLVAFAGSIVDRRDRGRPARGLV